MISVITYNILMGGTHRIEPLVQVLQAKQPDLVGLIEASDEHVVRALASRLGMEYRLSVLTKEQKGQPVALLSRLPILATLPSQPLPKHMPHLLGVQVAEPTGTPLTVLVTHLTANFNRGWRATQQRYREMRLVLDWTKTHQGRPHLLIGDFNAVAPGDRVKGSYLLRYLTDQRLYYQLIPSQTNPPKAHGLPSLDTVLPPSLRLLHPFLCSIPTSSILSFLLDRLQWLYAPHGGVKLLSKAGYVDCFRRLHPAEPGWTWPSVLPAGRIDFIFASQELASRLCACDVLSESLGLPVNQASDHLPVFAAFQPAVG